MPSRTGRSTGRIGAWVPALAAAMVLSGCSGGGGGDGSADLFHQWGLRTVKADRAYARLAARDGTGTAPGSGQTLGVVDTGIDRRHPAFAGKDVTQILLNDAVPETGDELSHGTAVASVMAGYPRDDDTASTRLPRGVAYGADIAMFAIPLGSGGGDYVPATLTGGSGSTDLQWASMIAQVTGWTRDGRTIDFANMSFGIQGIVEQYSEAELRRAFSLTIAALAQDGAPDKTVFVWAAGNGNGNPCDPADFTDHPQFCVEADGKHEVDARSVEVVAGLPVRISELEGNLIAVVAIGRDGEIAGFSNRCGVAAKWCIAAPGARVRVAYFGPDRDMNPGVRGAATVDGTSFAAPMVTGGLAVMKHIFRDQLSNTALVERLLATADDSGIYSEASIYGQGLMDLDAATTPLGATTIVLGELVAGSGSALAGTRFTSGGPLGNSLAQALAGQEIAAFDSLGAPFWFSLDGLAGAAPGRSILARLRAFAAPTLDDPEPGALRPRLAPLAAGRRVRLGVMQAPSSGADGGHLALGGRALALSTGGWNGLRIAAFSTEGIRGQSPATGATLSWRPDGSKLGLTGGWVGERETMLGSTTAGAFGRLSGASAFAGIEGRTKIAGWRLGAGAELGTVRAAARGGMIASVSPLATSAFALTARRTLANGDGIGFSAAQPLRVEAGRARLTVPAGRTKNGRVLRRSLTAGLEPSGRQIEIAARWHRSLRTAGELSLGAAWTRQPGHDADAAPDLSLLAGWRYAF